MALPRSGDDPLAQRRVGEIADHDQACGAHRRRPTSRHHIPHRNTSAARLDGGVRHGSWTPVRMTPRMGWWTGLQGSLLDLSDEVVVRPLESVRRMPLEHGPWVDLLPGWVGGADLLYEALGRTCRGTRSGARCTTRSSTCLASEVLRGGRRAPPTPPSPRRATRSPATTPRLGEPLRHRRTVPVPRRPGLPSPGTATGSAGPRAGHHGRDPLGRCPRDLLLPPP